MISHPAACIAALLAIGLVTPCNAGEATPNADAEPDMLTNRIDRLEPMPPGEPGVSPRDVHCTVDGLWCARIGVDEHTGDPLLAVLDGTSAAQARQIGQYPLHAGDDDEPMTLWPHIVRMPQADGRPEQAALLGVVTHMHEMYSGGGAGTERLTLVEVEVDPTFGMASFKEVLTVPLSSWAMIRACFSQADYEQRAGACHDEYNFSATLTPRQSKTGALEFDYVTTATSFPGPVSRGADSLADPPLTNQDLIQVVNDECSYRQVVRYNPTTERYEFDSPAPECSDFTAP